MSTARSDPPMPAVVLGDDLRRSCLMAALACLILLGQGLSMVSMAAGWGFRPLVVGWLVTVLALLSGMVVLRWRRVGAILFVVSLATLVLMASWWLASGAVLALLAVPVGLLVVFHGWRAGILGTVLGMVASTFVASRLHDPVAAGAAAALLWATIGLNSVVLRLAEDIAQWCLRRWAESQAQLEEARNQRLELKQAQQDLIQANAELARLAERLKAMRRVAEESQRAKEEFVANVSHELRTPLNMIIGFTEMISEAPSAYGTVSPRLLADIDVILRNSRHLSSLVDDILDLSQADAGRMALVRGWTSLDSIISTAVTAVTPLFDSRGLWLDTDVPNDLLVFCDEVRIRQVLVNLLSNAGRFTKSGGVTIRAWTDQANLVVAVRDTGPGIPVKYQQAIFEPFHRMGQQTDGSVAGSGLGLSISKRFVEMHGGKMWLESKEGEGTVFYFSVPRDGFEQTPSAGLSRWFSPYHEYEPRQRLAMVPDMALHPRFVLVERGQVMRRLLTRYLADAEIVGTQSLPEAIAQSAKAPATAIIVNDPDLQDLPTEADKLASLPYGTPMLACWVPDRHEATEKLRIAEYLLKPVTKTQLLQAIEHVASPVHTVLVVDDEPDVVQLLSRMLISAELGYRVLQAESGAEALTLLRERHPDLLLLDLLMPDMDGYALLSTMREDPEIADIPVIAVSAQDPTQGPIASSYLAIARSGGLSTRDLLNAIQAVTVALSPPDQLAPPRPDGGRGA